MENTFVYYSLLKSASCKMNTYCFIKSFKRIQYKLFKNNVKAFITNCYVKNYVVTSSTTLFDTDKDTFVVKTELERLAMTYKYRR